MVDMRNPTENAPVYATDSNDRKSYSSCDCSESTPVSENKYTPVNAEVLDPLRFATPVNAVQGWRTRNDEGYQDRQKERADGHLGQFAIATA